MRNREAHKQLDETESVSHRLLCFAREVHGSFAKTVFSFALIRCMHRYDQRLERGSAPGDLARKEEEIGFVSHSCPVGRCSELHSSKFPIQGQTRADERTETLLWLFLDVFDVAIIRVDVLEVDEDRVTPQRVHS